MSRPIPVRIGLDNGPSLRANPHVPPVTKQGQRGISPGVARSPGMAVDLHRLRRGAGLRCAGGLSASGLACGSPRRPDVPGGRGQLSQSRFRKSDDPAASGLLNLLHPILLSRRRPPRPMSRSVFGAVSGTASERAALSLLTQRALSPVHPAGNRRSSQPSPNPIGTGTATGFRSTHTSRVRGEQKARRRFGP